jgi:hypothetical protein
MKPPLVFIRAQLIHDYIYLITGTTYQVRFTSGYGGNPFSYSWEISQVTPEPMFIARGQSKYLPNCYYAEELLTKNKYLKKLYRW